MDKRLSGEHQATIAHFAKALAHPTRIAILEFLAGQETCFFGKIHEVLPIAKATVSQHLKELKEVGLIRGEIEPPKVRYCIDEEKWREARRLLGEFFNLRPCCAGCGRDCGEECPCSSHPVRTLCCSDTTEQT